MRCTRCNKPLFSPTVTVKTRGGLRFYGPKCSRLSFPPEPRKRVKQSQGTTTDPRQMGLPL